MKISAVIGSSFGDEGKGLVTDYLCSRSKSMVVRFNGGAQAGHTVVTPEGVKHVFHHVGSGAFVGAPTFLSKFFVCNPMFYHSELAHLKTLGLNPNVIIDPECPVTTPWDLMLNQAAEQSRGKQRHGSCGMGINETIERNQDRQYSLVASDIWYGLAFLREKLNLIRTDYVDKRRSELHITAEMPHVMSGGIFDNYCRDAYMMFNSARCASWGALNIDEYDLVFEGAQGLRLDMDNTEEFPHVTRSNTGLVNVKKLLSERGINQEVHAYYVSRTYLTRHGAGPLKNEIDEKPYPKVVDDTNIHNQHQGNLRFALLDSDHLSHHIHEDIAGWRGVVPHFALTCVDQLDGQPVKFIQNMGKGFDVMNAVCSLPPESFAIMIGESFDAASCLLSYGKTRNDIKEIHYAEE